jgi:hypothetical protein
MRSWWDLSGSRARALAVQSRSASALLIASVIALNVVLVLMGFVLTHYFGKDAVSSLTQFPDDGGTCNLAVEGVGVHCFNDYAIVRQLALASDPWDFKNGFRSNYPAAAMLPHMASAGFGELVGSVRAGLFVYLAMLMAALAAPAIWASKAKPAWMRLLAVGAFGVLSVPGLMVLDRGNSTGLLAPALLALFITVRRHNDRGAAIAMVVAILIKPQMVVLLVLFPAMRKWKLTFWTGGTVVAANLLAYLAWPSRFPNTLIETAHNIGAYSGGLSLAYQFPPDASFPEAIYLVEVAVRRLAGLQVDATWTDQYQTLVSLGAVAAICGVIFVLGRRLPAHISAILLAVTAALFPSVTWSYYLVICLPVAAVLLRDPLDARPDRERWHGILDAEGPRPRLQGLATILIVAATALSTSRLLGWTPAEVPGRGDVGNVVKTSTEFGVLVWLVAIGVSLLAFRGAREIVPAPTSDE